MMPMPIPMSMPHSGPEPSVSEQDYLNLNLMKENHSLKTWIAGMLAGCDGCTASARAFADAIGLQHEFTPIEVEEGTHEG